MLAAATKAGRLTAAAQQVRLSLPSGLPGLRNPSAVSQQRPDTLLPPVQTARHLSACAAAAAAAAAPPPSVGRLNHVAIAVPNVREAAAKYRDVLGVKVGWQTPLLWLPPPVARGCAPQPAASKVAARPPLSAPCRRRRPQVSEPQALPEHGVTVAFVELGNTKLELLEPLGAASPIAKFLERNAAGGM